MRNMRSGGMLMPLPRATTLFKLGYEGGVGLGEGFEVVEEGVDDVRGDEDGNRG